MRFRKLTSRPALAVAALAVAVPLTLAGAPTANADAAGSSAQASPIRSAPAAATHAAVGARPGGKAAAGLVFRTKFVQAGDWRTLESFFNASGTGFFLHPAGAQIKVRYGVGFLGFDRQKQTLDGVHEKTLSVGSTGSVARARMQIRVNQDTFVSYAVRP